MEKLHFSEFSTFCILLFGKLTFGSLKEAILATPLVLKKADIIYEWFTCLFTVDVVEEQSGLKQATCVVMSLRLYCRQLASAGDCLWQRVWMMIVVRTAQRTVGGCVLARVRLSPTDHLMICKHATQYSAVSPRALCRMDRTPYCLYDCWLLTVKARVKNVIFWTKIFSRRFVLWFVRNHGLRWDKMRFNESNHTV